MAKGKDLGVKWFFQLDDVLEGKKISAYFKNANSKLVKKRASVVSYSGRHQEMFKSFEGSPVRVFIQKPVKSLQHKGVRTS